MATRTDPESVIGDILIVDDEAANLQLLTQLLTEAGYRVRPAEKPALALDSARVHPPDLILLDVRMPEMDGLEVCRRLKQDGRTRNVPIIFVSALHDLEVRVQGFELGAVDFVSKPFQELEILARVGTHVALHKVTEQLEDIVAERTAALTARNLALNAEIEERTRAEARLRESRRFNDYLIDAANVMIVGLDARGTVTLANPAVERDTGYAPSELLGRDWFELLIPERSGAEVRAEFARLVTGGSPRRFENTILTRSGEKRIIAWSNSPLENEGQVVGVLSFGMDVTERREQERQLQEYQRRLKALASDLTITEERERRRLAEELHDGPVQALAYTRMLLASARQQADSSLQSQSLDALSESLREAAFAISRIVSDLSTTAMKELGLMAAISDWANEKIENRFGIETIVTSHLMPAEAQDLEDLTRTILFRNVRELLANVVKHAQASRVHVLLEKTGENLELTVQDDGQGCYPDRVLDVSSREGGFGLFSIRERMADLGGSLEIESAPGQGFKATLTVPLPLDRPIASG